MALHLESSAEKAYSRKILQAVVAHAVSENFPSSSLQEKLKPGYLEQLPGKLKLFSQFLGKRKWFAGEKITFVDFVMYDILDQNRMFEPKCLDQFQNLKDFLDRFEVRFALTPVMHCSGYPGTTQLQTLTPLQRTGQQAKNFIC
nr:glutathione S-transferase Mu 3-like [Chrysemys picta bellii]